MRVNSYLMLFKYIGGFLLVLEISLAYGLRFRYILKKTSLYCPFIPRTLIFTSNSPKSLNTDTSLVNKGFIVETKLGLLSSLYHLTSGLTITITSLLRHGSGQSEPVKVLSSRDKRIFTTLCYLDLSRRLNLVFSSMQRLAFYTSRKEILNLPRGSIIYFHVSSMNPLRFWFCVTVS